jgi:hypothetical protein
MYQIILAAVFTGYLLMVSGCQVDSRHFDHLTRQDRNHIADALLGGAGY